MPTSRIATFAAHPATVFETLLDAAEALGTRTRVIDAETHQVTVSSDGKPYRVSASVTDNGWGECTLHLSWTPLGSSGGGKCAKRLLIATRSLLDEMAAPPPPPPPPPPPQPPPMER